MLILSIEPTYSFQQITNPNNTIEVKTKKTEYGNILGESIKEDLNSFQGKENLNIKISFLKGLETAQFSEKKENGKVFFFVSFYTPQYEAIVLDNEGKELLHKKYGDEKTRTEFGKISEYTDGNELMKDWRKQKELFYKKEEAKYNNVQFFLKDLQSLDHRTIVESSEPQETTIRDINPSREIDEITPPENNNETKEVLTQQNTEKEIEEVELQNDKPLEDVSIDKPEIQNTNLGIEVDKPNNEDTDTPIIAEPYFEEIELRDLRDHRLIVSLGSGLGNLRKYDYKLSSPIIGGSIDRYSFHNTLGVDWLFVGGWVGLGKYKDKNFEGSSSISELSIISRYGVSITRILQDAGRMNELTNKIDMYALFQFGYAIILVDDFFIPFNSGTEIGIALGARYSWKKFGAFVELGKTETGFLKSGIFLKI